MRYRREFTIGRRETQDFYVALALDHWRKGILGFGAAGALAVWMYLGYFLPELSLPLQVLLAVGGALVTAAVVALGLVLSTRAKVSGRLRRTGKSSYLQEVEIDGFGVHVTADGKRAKLGFDKLTQVRETDRAFYIFLSANQAWLLPKAQMEDRAAECRQLRQIFQTVIESGRLRLKK